MADTKNMNIVVVEGSALNPGDLDWSEIAELGHLKVHESSLQEELTIQAKEADILVMNKLIVDTSILSALPRLKYIAITATGYNNIDLIATQQQGIQVSNIQGYGTKSVAQHTFALLLSLTNRVYQHHLSVQNGDWGRNSDFAYQLSPMTELANKTIGLVGFGRIAKKVAEIAQAFDMNVLVNSQYPDSTNYPFIQFTDLNTLCQEADIVSLHSPLKKDNYRFLNASYLSLMKPSAFLINTGRGNLINEEDLAKALQTGQIAGAALDVVSEEPPVNGNVLFGLNNCIITPHNAWYTIESRTRLMQILASNIRSFIAGKPENLVFPST